MNSDGLNEGKLGDIAEIIMGQSPEGSNCNEVGVGVPLLNGPTEFGGRYPFPVQFTTDPRKYAEENDLLFCVRGSTTGRMNWADQRYAIGRGLAAIRHKNGKDYHGFLRGIIEFKLDSLLTEATGSTFPNVSRQQIENLKIPILPLSSQHRIASILTALDDKIELNRRMNETLDGIAQAVWGEWFGKYASGEVELPVGWQEYKLGDLVESVSKTYKFTQDKIIFLNTSDILDGQILTNEYSEVATLPGQAKKSIQRNDILYSEIRPANKRYAFVNFHADEFVVSTKLMVLRSKGIFDPLLLYFFLTRKEILDHLQMLAESRSGTFPQITFDHIKVLKFRFPDEKTVEEFTSLLKPLYEQKFENETQSRTLTALRDELLPRLMRGEVEV
jgi:type I restriction enzyme S subunit